MESVMVPASLDSLCEQSSKSLSKDAGTMTEVYLILGLIHRFSQIDETRLPREGGDPSLKKAGSQCGKWIPAFAGKTKWPKR